MLNKLIFAALLIFSAVFIINKSKITYDYEPDAIEAAESISRGLMPYSYGFEKYPHLPLFPHTLSLLVNLKLNPKMIGVIHIITSIVIFIKNPYAGIIYAIHPISLFGSTLIDHADTTTLPLLFLLFYSTNKLIARIILFSIALAMKETTPLVMPLSLFIYGVLRDKKEIKNSLIILFSGILFAIIYLLIFSMIYDPSYIKFLLKALTQKVEKHFEFKAMIIDILRFIIYINPFIAYIYMKNIKINERFIAIVIVLFTYTFITKTGVCINGFPKYFAPVFPLLLLDINAKFEVKKFIIPVILSIIFIPDYLYYFGTELKEAIFFGYTPVLLHKIICTIMVAIILAMLFKKTHTVAFAVSIIPAIKAYPENYKLVYGYGEYGKDEVIKLYSNTKLATLYEISYYTKSEIFPRSIWIKENLIDEIIKRGGVIFSFSANTMKQAELLLSSDRLKKLFTLKKIGSWWIYEKETATQLKGVIHIHTKDSPFAERDFLKPLEVQKSLDMDFGFRAETFPNFPFLPEFVKKIYYKKFVKKIKNLYPGIEVSPFYYPVIKNKEVILKDFHNHILLLGDINKKMLEELPVMWNIYGNIPVAVFFLVIYLITKTKTMLIISFFSITILPPFYSKKFYYENLLNYSHAKNLVSILSHPDKNYITEKKFLSVKIKTSTDTSEIFSYNIDGFGLLWEGRTKLNIWDTENENFKNGNRKRPLYAFGERDFKSVRSDYPLNAIYNVVLSENNIHSITSALKNGRFYVATNPESNPKIKMQNDTLILYDIPAGTVIKKVKNGVYTQFYGNRLETKDARYEIYAPGKMIFTNPQF